MARGFASIVTREARGRTRFGLGFRVEGEEHYAWLVPIGTRWIAHSSRDMAEVGELTERRVDIIERCSHRGYPDPIWNVSVFALDYGYMETPKLHLLGRVGPRTTQLTMSAAHACLNHLADRNGMPAAQKCPS
jgi:hypothetical protein